MSSEGDTEWFCSGVTEDILTQLSKIKGLKVISRTSTERYKNTDKSIPEIAKELGVVYVVEGSVRKHNDDVRITSQLINASDEHIWADNFDAKMTDIFKTQEDVAKQIVQQLKIKISPEEEKNLSAFPTNNIEAYEAFNRGLNFFNNNDFEKGIAFFEKAIKLDPDFADAYAELAFIHFNNFMSNRASDSLKIIENIDKALTLNPNSSRANSYKGVILNFVNKKPDEGLVYLERALQLNPSNSRAHTMMAGYYAFDPKNNDDDYAKALYHINKAVELDPFLLQANRFKINILTQSGKIDLAEAHFLEKSSLFSEGEKTFFSFNIIDERARLSKKINQEEEIKIYNNAIKKYPYNENRFIARLAGAYDAIYNDDETYLEYSNKAYILDSTSVVIARQLHAALVENGLFEEALKFQTSDHIKQMMHRGNNMLQLQQYYHYHKGEYEITREILNDSMMVNWRSQRALNYAQLGELDKVNEILPTISSINKAFTFAILKQRDSMYYYLNKDDVNSTQAKFPNSRSEFNPYRKEQRYIEFLKKHHFPIDKQKNQK